NTVNSINTGNRHNITNCKSASNGGNGKSRTASNGWNTVKRSSRECAGDKLDNCLIRKPGRTQCLIHHAFVILIRNGTLWIEQAGQTGYNAGFRPWIVDDL